MDSFSTAIHIAAIAHYVFMIDPFKNNPEHRVSQKMLGQKKWLVWNTVVALLIFLAAVIKSINGDTDAAIFCSIPLLFILLLKITDTIFKTYYKKNFRLIVRGDTYLSQGVFAFIMSNVILIFPLAVPIVIMLLW